MNAGLRSHFGTIQALWRHRRAPLEWRAGALGRIGWPLLLLSHVLLPVAALPALLGIALAAAGGSVQPLSTMIVALMIAGWVRVSVAAALAPAQARPALSTLSSALMPTWLVYRALRLAIAWRSVIRVVDGVPIDRGNPAKQYTALAYAAMRRSLVARH